MEPVFGIQEVLFGDGLAIVCPRPSCGFVEVMALKVIQDYALAHRGCAACGIPAQIPAVEVVAS